MYSSSDLCFFPMALRSHFLAVFLFSATLSSCLVVSASLVEGKVSCFDCPNDYDYSGITVGVSCSHTNTRFTVTTDKKGDFISELPSKIESNCEAELQGSVKQLYASKNNVKSKIVKLGGDKYGLSSKLFFLKSCPRSFGSFSSSKTVDLPVPPEWGLAPTSYYVPFLPIIGIP
ncbi:hypothetical protein AtNW77_Chr2g0246841 [Arabidopsis thaliana]|uniref:Pollen Ole e 1 allergen and extensin family protein n=5 Tax=Arabidopsis TaxID=3701 RepID=F4IFT4_ARATH|nr:Pollen Ole e 1 allergen and extensin family protein [Arabidopsis thaliana]NP_850100.2 Pollen Ole e 1 allergen and extensin family protein [Arabidopsis thaliana]KAG7637647.1 hypothetical protein ISN45_At02g021500 [Arabidopsis thaliana x Arabidopsis arenosa]AEC07988.1 Pollen Ole e 1 allergen and extensin family protein [Arabidopsis thaliana]AEC07990.2 Pollen Ole e 1 allergen and extensin family protein [Arabidopsis thaliana]OAP10852.1 hypothetical protein AXX17_AT2G23370 [Arabidopsis thaliana|eukprot:NP_001318298.1 Pollen Ole e 1 allergen and extensin family protein [Arabidopsis thaliana]